MSLFGYGGELGGGGAFASLLSAVYPYLGMLTCTDTAVGCLLSHYLHNVFLHPPHAPMPLVGVYTSTWSCGTHI